MKSFWGFTSGILSVIMMALIAVVHQQQTQLDKLRLLQTRVQTQQIVCPAIGLPEGYTIDQPTTIDPSDVCVGESCSH